MAGPRKVDYTDIEDPAIDEQYLRVSRIGAAAYNRALPNGAGSSEKVTLTALGYAINGHPGRQALFFSNANASGNMYISTQVAQPSANGHATWVCVALDDKTIPIGPDIEVWVWGDAADMEYTVVEAL